MRSTEGMTPERVAKREKEAADVKAIGAIVDRLLEMRRSEFVGIEKLEGFEAQQIRGAAKLMGMVPEQVVVANVHNTPEASAARSNAALGRGRGTKIEGKDDGVNWTLRLATLHPYGWVVIDDENNGLWCPRETAEAIMNDSFSRSSALVMLLRVRAANKLPWDWAKFLAFDDFNFNHDFYGIVNSAEVPSGKLLRGFLPRCARG